MVTLLVFLLRGYFSGLFSGFLRRNVAFMLFLLSLSQ